MTPDDSPVTSALTLAAAGIASVQVPAMAAAGFGEGQDPRPMLAWYAIGGLAFLAMFARNIVGLFTDVGKIRGSKRRRQMEEDGEAPPATVDWQTHNKEIGEAHQKVDRLETDLVRKIEDVRRELTEQVSRLGNTVSGVAADAAAAKAGANATNGLLRDLVKRLTKGGAIQ